MTSALLDPHDEADLTPAPAPSRNTEPTPAEETAGIWEALPVLSGGGLLFVAVLCGVFWLTSLFPLHHSDLWGHLSWGRWMVENGRLPEADPFRPGLPAASRFVNVPWLAQLAGYELFAWAGVDGLSLAHAVLVTLAVGLLAGAIAARQVPWGWATVGAAAGFVLSLPVVGALRPQVCGWSACAGMLWGVARIERRRDPLVWLPLVMALWSNLHGSVAVGLAIVLTATLGATIEHLTGRRDSRATAPLGRWWVLAGLAILATCCQPLGPALLAEVAWFGRNPLVAQLSEWRPLSIDSLSGQLFFGSLAVTGVLLRWSPRRWTAGEVGLLLLTGLLALSALRMLAWWALIWPWVVWPHAAALGAMWREPAAAGVEPPGAAVRRGLIGLALVIAALIWAPASRALISGQPRGPAVAVSRETPFFLGEQVAERQLAGRCFAPLDWADYFIWQSQGRLHPLLYSHVHLADPAVWSDYRALDRGQAAWLEVVDREQIRWLLLDNRRQGALFVAAEREARCRLRYQDQQATLFEILPATKTTKSARAKNSPPIGKPFAQWPGAQSLSASGR